ncbi:hypothetical protein Bbelb_420720 [Branchiostoma belcheri]|nr:hypothetical protein Bbelb_420720 [Branchiostoma belcheri]
MNAESVVGRMAFSTKESTNGRKGEKYSLKLRELTSQMSLPSLASKTCLRESTLMKEGVAAAAVGEAPSEVEWTELLQPCSGPHDQTPPVTSLRAGSPNCQHILQYLFT